MKTGIILSLALLAMFVAPRALIARQYDRWDRVPDGAELRREIRERIQDARVHARERIRDRAEIRREVQRLRSEIRSHLGSGGHLDRDPDGREYRDAIHDAMRELRHSLRDGFRDRW